MSELVKIEKTTVLEVFTKESGLNPYIEEIRGQVNSFVADLSTAKGRKEIASLAHKVAQSKTYLDGLGKELVSDWKAKAKAVDESRKYMRDELDKIKIQARQPLTDWENKEEERINTIKQRIDDSFVFRFDAIGTSAEASEMLATVQDVAIDGSFDEYKGDAGEAKDTAIRELRYVIERLTKQEAEREELARLRKEEEERKERERIEKIKEEAAREATRVAEEKAKKEKEAAERMQREAAEKAEREKAIIEADRIAAVKAKEAAEAAQKQAEESLRILDGNAKKEGELMARSYASCETKKEAVSECLLSGALSKDVYTAMWYAIEASRK